VLDSIAVGNGLSLRVQGPTPVISRIRSALRRSTR